MNRPPIRPLGLQLARTAKQVGRAFEDELASAGGSLPAWLILLALKTGDWSSQGQMARSIGIEGPTLTHHLDGMERDGLVTRTRNPDNRRVQNVTLTKAGEAAFLKLRKAAMTFDARLREGLDATEIAALEGLLERLATNVAPDQA